jgi:1,4-dihydroxy-2-naphthoate octaprenyltransferase
MRLRTLPLALSCVVLGSLLAASHGHFRLGVALLSGLTIALLQVLSNLANDYGDSRHGADGQQRQGPSRAVQSGAISAGRMRRAVQGLALASLLSGLALLAVSFGPDQWPKLLVFLGLGLGCIWAAVAYTATDKPYGYAGLGDIFVLLCFGLVGVMGTYYLHGQVLPALVALPALSLGLFSVGVLNVNNIRDISSDALAGKRSIPVRIGRAWAVRYHWALLLLGFGCAAGYALLQGQGGAWQAWLFMGTAPLFWRNARQVAALQEPRLLDPFLKQLALSTFAFSLLFGLGHWLAAQ